MKRKRYVSGLLFPLVIVMFLLSACGTSATPEATTAPTQAQPTERPTERPTEAPTAVPAPTETQEVTQPTEEASVLDGEGLLESRCTRCHDLNRVRNAKKTLAEWEQNVTRMIGKGAELNEEEKDFLVNFLAETYGP